jgi:hypothetical protein
VSVKHTKQSCQKECFLSTYGSFGTTAQSGHALVAVHCADDDGVLARDWLVI